MRPRRYSHLEEDTPKPKLLLYFDIRNTILVADSIANVTVEQCMNTYLTSVAWGTVHESLQNNRKQKSWSWLEGPPLPSITKPAPHAISYYKFAESLIENALLPRFRFRRSLGDFTRTPTGERYSSVFDQALKHLRYPYEPNDYLSMLGQSGLQYHYILPSFFELLHYLRDTARDYTIVLRTFGLDAPNILKTVQVMAQGSHPEFAAYPELIVDEKTGKISRSSPHKFTLKHSDTLLKTESEIHDHFLHSTSHVMGIIDDFSYWSSHSYSHEAGKPIWFDGPETPRRAGSDPEHFQMFFDDNIRLTDSDSIVNGRVFVDGERTATRSLSSEQMQHKSSQLVQVDLLRAIENRKYYVQLVQMAEKGIYLDRKNSSYF